MKNTIKTPLACTLFAASMIGASQASTILDFRPEVAGNGSTSVNVTSGKGANLLDEVASKFVDVDGFRDGDPLPVLGSFGGAGMNIDGQEVTFTVDSIVDYTGGSNAFFRADMNGNGVGISSATGQWFAMDGQEAFTWTASTSLQFEGMSLRTWSNTGTRGLTIQSNDWINLIGVNSATGISYDSGAGAFTLSEVDGNVIDDNGNLFTLVDLVGGSGPTLDFNTITVSNSGDDGTAFKTMSFAAVAVPEPSSTALLGLAGFALILRRRK